MRRNRKIVMGIVGIGMITSCGTKREENTYSKRILKTNINEALKSREEEKTREYYEGIINEKYEKIKEDIDNRRKTGETSGHILKRKGDANTSEIDIYYDHKYIKEIDNKIYYNEIEIKDKKVQRELQEIIRDENKKTGKTEEDIKDDVKEENKIVDEAKELKNRMKDIYYDADYIEEIDNKIYYNGAEIKEPMLEKNLQKMLEDRTMNKTKVIDDTKDKVENTYEDTKENIKSMFEKDKRLY